MCIDQIKTVDDRDEAVIEHVAVLHALEAGIRSLSRHPEATDLLLSWLCEEYGEVQQLEKLTLPPEADKPE
ncbi:MAG: hypothetical protein IJG24_06800 [Selenomonadaceae bacterium]|nr:hypothetical protein [Selenomonadaceae bacterium]